MWGIETVWQWESLTGSMLVEMKGIQLENVTAEQLVILNLVYKTVFLLEL